MKKKNIVVTLLLVLGLLSITLGVSVAFFNYTRTGSANVLAVGRIYFNSTQGTSISLTNVFPVKSTELENNPNVDSVTLTITGDTTFDEGLEYLISADQVVNTVSGKQVPVGTSVTVNNLGTADDSYFVNRGGNTSIYKILSKDTIKEDGELVVGYITKGATGVNGTVTVSAWIDADKIAISDTYDGTESDNNGTTNEWVDGRTVLTTVEWNSLQTNGISFKVKVEANEGIWVEEEATPDSCFTYELGSDYISIIDYDANCGTKVVIPKRANIKVYVHNDAIGPSEVNTCVDYLSNDLGLTVNNDNNETMENFCNGAGTMWGNTFNESILYNYFSDNELEYLESQNIIKWGTYSGNITQINNTYDPVEELIIGAFMDKGLTSVIIPNGITRIGENAFANNYLTSVIIPNSVTQLDQAAFENNRLVTVSLSDNLEYIGGYSFKDNNIVSISLPDNINSIPAQAFRNNNLTDIYISDSVTSIGDYAFAGNNIASVHLRDGIFYDHNISKTSFDWDKVEILYLNVRDIGFNGNIYYISEQLSGQLILGDKVKTIDHDVFRNSNLTNVTIGSSITSIGSTAFYKDGSHNTNLASITINKSCSEIKAMYDYPWIGSSYRAGTTIYGANNEVCDSY